MVTEETLETTIKGGGLYGNHPVSVRITAEGRCEKTFDDLRRLVAAHLDGETVTVEAPDE